MIDATGRRGRRAKIATIFPQGRVTEQAGPDERHVAAATRRLRAVLYIRVSTEGQAEHGYSLPEQEEVGVQYISDHGWELADIYIDHESAFNNSGDRPQFKAMLKRAHEQRDVDVVVVKKLDRFARDAALHMSVRKALTKIGIQFHCIEQKIEDTAAGWLGESIQAVVNEYFSRNLSGNVKDGMRKKAELGAAPGMAPLGYLNRRQIIDGREVASVVLDDERAPLVRDAFRLYATGDYTLEQLADELRIRGLTTRGRANAPSRPVPINGLAWLLGNPFYTGVFVWNGVEYQGRHPTLIDRETFDRVEHVLASRSRRGIRERRHPHYLKGTLFCVCERRLSIDVAKGHTYLYCLGQRDRRKPRECREPYVRVERIEEQIEALYQRVQLPTLLAERFRALADAEMARHMDAHAGQREFQAKRLAKLEHERRKLMDAYYGGAVDIAMLKAEQDRIGAEARDCERLLRDVSATLERWQRVLATALRFATDCAATYRRADERTRARYNAVVFEGLTVSGGQIVDVRYAEPFGGVFGLPGLEYDDLVPATGLEPVTKGLRV